MGKTVTVTLLELLTQLRRRPDLATEYRVNSYFGGYKQSAFSSDLRFLNRPVRKLVF